jgi:tetratricopeptide (TPR) repeat protein
LVCTAGPYPGRTFELRGTEVVIGRSPRSGIAIADPAVSRRHLLLRSSGSGWIAEDLGSGNGTIVNLGRIVQPTPLADGDVLILGDTQLCFHAGASHRLAPRLRSPSVPGSSHCSAAGGSHRLAQRLRSLLHGRRLVVLSLIPALVLAGLGLRAHQASVAQSEEVRRAKEAAAHAFQRGKKLVRQGDWRQAQLTFEGIQAQAPGFPGLEDYIERGKKEIENQNLLERARAALEEDELGAAAEALGNLSPDTQLHSQAHEVRRLLEQRVAAQMSEAQRAIGERDYPRVLEITEDVLKAFPKNAEAESLAERARRKMAARPKPVAQGRLAVMRNAAAQRFRAGDLKGAISAAERCAVKASEPCRHLLGQLQEIAGLLGRTQQLELRDLERLLELDMRAAGGHASSLVAPAVARAAGLYYNEAVRAKGAAQWPRAMELAARALRLAPDHRAALAIVSELKARAKELFVFAYSLKDTAPDEAVQRFKEVLALTPADDEFHRKAQTWIEKLSR